MHYKKLIYSLNALFICYLCYDYHFNHTTMRIDIEEHNKHQWRVHSLLPDFEVEDVWELPITLEDDHSIEQVQDLFVETLKNVGSTGVTGALFKLRFYLGRVFNWDEPIATNPDYGLKEGSIRARYAEQECIFSKDMPTKGFADFEPVYLMPNEALLEIENATVHAALHLGKVVRKDGSYTAQMTVYVKTKGFLSKVYMMAILPFRWYIVYPTMLNTIKKQWEQKLEAKEALHAVCF